jgi:putative tricarboxylic transport membrane protein
MLDAALSALLLLIEPARLAILLGGVLIGLALGAIPGLGGVVGLAVMIPFTYGLDAPTAFALLLGMAAVTTSSDLIPAILFGVPGSVGAAATTIDGHAMARAGQAGRAFGAGFAASLLGGLFGALILALAIPLLQPVLLSIGSPEMLAFSIFGLSMVATLSGRAPLKGLTAACLGLMLSMVGAGAQTGTLRWTFDWLYLWDGLPLVPVMLGLFALPELAEMAISRRAIAPAAQSAITLATQWDGVRDALRNWRLVLRCSALGTALGIVPGIGSSVIDWIVYGYAQRSIRDSRFGEGDVRGVIAPEAANNAKEGGHLVPTIAFGVPAGASMTLLLGAFLMHGLTPGPEMLGKHLDITYAIIWTLTLAHVIGAAICLLASSQLARLAEIRHAVMLPLIVPVVFIAAFQGSRAWGDLYVLLAAGLLGWAMKRLDWPRPPLVLGLVIGRIFERYLFISLELYGNGWVLRPVVIAVGLVIGWTLFSPLRQALRAIAGDLRGLRLAAWRPRAGAGFALLIVGIVAAALATSADWPGAERVVPRSAGWAGLALSLLTLLAEAFGPAKANPGGQGALPPALLVRRAAGWFGWLLMLLVLCALAGFIPAIAIFVFAYMVWGFGEGWRRGAAFGAGLALLCWAVFDQGLSVPWPQALLGDLFPWLRERGGLM